jgi:magnesium chelatase family protein
LGGDIKESSHIFSLILSMAKDKKMKKFIVPLSLAPILALIPNIDIYPVSTLKNTIDFLMGEADIELFKKIDPNLLYITKDNKKYFYPSIKNISSDFIDVRGQQIAKRGALISAVGFHNIIFEGSPGCGKSMISKRMIDILPPISLNEMLDIMKVQYLYLSKIEDKIFRAFRSPHNSSTKSSIFGGGSKTSSIGEVALANHGILFFDELPHFAKNILESLREPLEDNKVLISRVNSKIDYDAKFLFIGAMNPCPCGNLFSSTKECRCQDLEIQRYKNKISDPIYDRIDLYVSMNEVSSEDKSDINTKQMKEKVIKAFIKQKQRGQENLNGKLSDLEINKYCTLDNNASEILDKAQNSFSLSFRSIHKVKKVARSIADLDDKDIISKSHILEALSFRKR